MNHTNDERRRLPLPRACRRLDAVLKGTRPLAHSARAVRTVDPHHRIRFGGHLQAAHISSEFISDSRLTLLPGRAIPQFRGGMSPLSSHCAGRRRLAAAGGWRRHEEARTEGCERSSPP